MLFTSLIVPVVFTASNAGLPSNTRPPGRKTKFVCKKVTPLWAIKISQQCLEKILCGQSKHLCMTVGNQNFPAMFSALPSGPSRRRSEGVKVTLESFKNIGIPRSHLGTSVGVKMHRHISHNQCLCPVTNVRTCNFAEV